MMGTLGWSIHRPEGIVVVSGGGIFNLSFFRSFRETMRAEGAVGYCKLFDLRDADIQLSSDDLEAIAASTQTNNSSVAGPIALVVGNNPSPLLLDMAILLKHRIGDRRRLRVFTDEAEARQWFPSTASAHRSRVDRLPGRIASNENR